VIEVQLDLDGYPVTVIDTAGVRETDDPVEQEGVRRARARAAEADLVLWLVDAEHEKVLHQGVAPEWTVRNKIDLDGASAVLSQRSDGTDFKISASRGDGIPELIGALITFAQEYFGGGGGGLIGRERQRKLLQDAANMLQRSIDVIGEGEEFAAEELRAAAHSLGRLLGRVDVEDILGAIFKDFCIGK
jgi:tRNA modification GTPase